MEHVIPKDHLEPFMVGSVFDWLFSEFSQGKQDMLHNDRAYRTITTQNDYNTGLQRWPWLEDADAMDSCADFEVVNADSKEVRSQRLELIYCGFDCIVSGATTWDDPITGQTYILEINKSFPSKWRAFY